MDHMKLLKQGVEEEAAACPPEFRLESAYVDPVAKVEALSAQLIILASFTYFNLMAWLEK